MERETLKEFSNVLTYEGKRETGDEDAGPTRLVI
jgi:hypothetical protein